MAVTLSDVLDVLRNEDIARRYFVMNSFDGALTILGIIIALYLAGIMEVQVIIVSCVGAAVAMGVSGFWGAYAAERAERMLEFKELERHMMRKLYGTDVEAMMKVKTLIIALVDGLSPAIVSIIILIPFVLTDSDVFTVRDAYHASMILVAAVLMGLGAFVGSIAKEGITRNAVKMLTAGVLVALLSIVLASMKII